MTSKENGDLGDARHPFIKPEPMETRLAPLAVTTSWQSLAGHDPIPRIKAEPIDAACVFSDRGLPVPSYVQEAIVFASSAVPLPASKVKPENADGGSLPLMPEVQQEENPVIEFPVFDSAADISYTPENAFNTGLGMVKCIRENIKKIEVGSKLRKDVWFRELESLQAQGTPTTMIAVCGATGAGKSSLLNAILNDNIVPTSGMRACTAVVTEISYHQKRTINADVSFLSLAEWKEELEVLLDDLIDENGRLKRVNDLKSDAGVAWSKVHAVYPSLVQDQLAGMTADQLIAHDPKIAKILGTTKNIVAKNSKTFAEEIAKYIDSKDQKRGNKQKRAKDKTNGSGGQSTKKKQDDNGPALWPLIRQVNVRCSSACLSTGVILVDLPGVADANAARNSIAKDYMKKCDCIWILAPITRAVDDKTAKELLGDAFKLQLLMDGNYDPHTITFIASKCDDISCSEVIRALGLESNPLLEEIEERLDQITQERREWKSKKAGAIEACKTIDASLKEAREYKGEYEAHLNALEKGEPFESRLMSKAPKDTNGKKRKNKRGGKRVSKRARSSDDDNFSLRDNDDDEDMGDATASDASSEVNDSIFDSNEESVDEDRSYSSSHSGSESEDGNDDGENDNDEGSEEEDDQEEGSGEEDDQEEVTTDILKAKIEESKATIKSGRDQLSEARKAKKDASDALASLDKRQKKAQREKNAFCSLKRSEFSRDVLKEDFRQGLKELDDSVAEERDPDAFDPSVNLRNYDEIDLPVFTCSSRDYIRLRGQVKGDGSPICFSDVEDTGIPSLQQWCHTLTIANRERSARIFLTQLRAFATSVRSYVEGIGSVTIRDRETLRAKWESSNPNANDTPDESDYDSDDYAMHGIDFHDLEQFITDGRISSKKRSERKVDTLGDAVGITPTLAKNFSEVIDKTVQELKACFREGLEEKCRLGAANAADAAVETSDGFAASMHWGTYRATLRRWGSWRRDLNMELSSPFTRNIAHSWAKIFEGDLFSSFEKRAKETIAKLLEDVMNSAAPVLKERARGQVQICSEEACVALRKTLEVVRETLSSEQKEVSRSLAPHVQDQLRDAYNRAMDERGRGSVARQKMIFHDSIGRLKNEIFDDGADVILGRLSAAAEAIGDALDDALTDIAKKVEVSMSILWEGPRDDPRQAAARKQVVDSLSHVLDQVRKWQEAESARTADAN